LFQALKDLKSPIVKEIRHRGLLGAIEIIETPTLKGRDICLKLLEKGLITNVTKSKNLRIIPPLIINESQVKQSVDIFKSVLCAWFRFIYLQVFNGTSIRD